jgi:hypothetical protein
LAVTHDDREPDRARSDGVTLLDSDRFPGHPSPVLVVIVDLILASNRRSG